MSSASNMAGRRPVHEYYTNNKRPSFAKTYYPTAEEFSDPFTYVNSIRKDGVRYGVIKIVPPTNFKPPFSLARSLEFRPRAQKLCLTDVFIKEHHLIFEKLREFYDDDEDKRKVPMFDGKELNFAIFFRSLEKRNLKKKGETDDFWKKVVADCGIQQKHWVSLKYYYQVVVREFHMYLKQEQLLRKLASEGKTTEKMREFLEERRAEIAAAEALEKELQMQNAPSPPDITDDCHPPTLEKAVPIEPVIDISFLPGEDCRLITLPVLSLEKPIVPEIDLTISDDDDDSLSDAPILEPMIKKPRLSNDSDDDVQIIDIPKLSQEITIEREETPPPRIARPERKAKNDFLKKLPAQTQLLRDTDDEFESDVELCEENSVDRTIKIIEKDQQDMCELPEFSEEDDDEEEEEEEESEDEDADYLPTYELQEYYKENLPKAVIDQNIPREFIIANSVAKNFFDAPECYTLQGFKDHADRFKSLYFKIKKPTDVSIDEVEAEFWRQLGDMTSDLYAFYGADLNSGNFGSGFPMMPKSKEEEERMSENFMFYAKHPWNLNNMPIASKSAFSHLEANISGMTIPWVYVGMCFSLFCWHVEDHWTYSINYMHEGETKVWYGIPEEDAPKFDSLVHNIAPESISENKDLLHHMNTMVNPQFLRDHGIRVYTVHQNVGDIVITFPRSYHAGFNAGYNVAEAVNFAPYDWLKEGRMCLQNYADTGRSCVFSHDLLVLNMIKRRKQLDLNMRRAVFGELCAIMNRDCGYRKHLRKTGFNFKRRSLQLSEIVHNEDFRSCVHCNTLLYSCAVICKHMRTACPIHYDDLCDICLPSEYRFAFSEDSYSLLNRLYDFTFRSLRNRPVKRLVELFDFLFNKRVISLEDSLEVVHLTVDKDHKTYMKLVRKVIKTAKILFDENSTKRINSVIPYNPAYPWYLLKRHAKKYTPPSGVKISPPKKPRRIPEEIRLRRMIGHVWCRHNSEGGVCQKCQYSRAWFPPKFPELTYNSDESEDERTILPQSDDIHPFRTALQILRLRSSNPIRQQRFLNKLLEYHSLELGDLADGTVITDDIERLDFLVKVAVLRAAFEITEYKKVNGVRNAARDAGCTTKQGNYTNYFFKDLEEMKEKGLRHTYHSDVRKGIKFLDFLVERGCKCNRDILDYWKLNMKHPQGYQSAIAFGEKVVYPNTWFGEALYMSFFVTHEKSLQIGKELEYFHNKTLHTTAAVEQMSRRLSQHRFLRNSRDHKTMKKIVPYLRRLDRFLTRSFKQVNSYYSIYEIFLGRHDLKKLFETGNSPLKPNFGGPMDFVLDKLFYKRENVDPYMEEGHKFLKECLPVIVELNVDPQPTERKIWCSCGVTVKPDPLKPLNWIKCICCKTVLHLACAIWKENFDHIKKGTFYCARCCRGKKPRLNTLQALVNQDFADMSSSYLLAEFVKQQKNIYKEFLKIKWESLPKLEFHKATSVILAADVDYKNLEEKILNHRHNSSYYNKEQTLRMRMLRKLNKVCEQTGSYRKAIYDFSKPRAKGFTNTTILREPRIFESFNVPCKHLNCIKPSGRPMTFRCSTKKCPYFCHFECIHYDLNFIEGLAEFLCPDCSSRKK